MTGVAASLKQSVQDHWANEVCGTREGDLDQVTQHRQRTHPYLDRWANYGFGKDRDVLEIGLGTGVDLCQWASAGARVTGVDLTQQAVDTSLARANRMGLSVHAATGDAEALAFADATFDIVYSFGVLHHTPNTPKAFSEAFRVLRPGGLLKAMIYRVPSWTGFLLAAIHRTSPRKAIYDHLESPGTKAYTLAEASALLGGCGFTNLEFQIELAPGDTLDMTLGPKYQRPLFKLLKALYPGTLIKLIGRRLGLFLLITARKPQGR